MAPEKSLEAVVWVAVGGRGTLIGPVLGAVGVNALKSWATRAYPDLWLLILGGLFILITVFMPKGLIGLPDQLRALWRRRRGGPFHATASLPGPLRMSCERRRARIK
jgi:urea transport system permease protein